MNNKESCVTYFTKTICGNTVIYDYYKREEYLKLLEKELVIIPVVFYNNYEIISDINIITTLKEISCN